MYVELKNINKNFGSFKASDNVSFGIEKGKLIGEVKDNKLYLVFSKDGKYLNYKDYI